MTETIAFIAGVGFVVIVLPIAEQVANVIATVLEVIRAKASMYITRCNVDMEKMQNELEGNGQAIGFEVPSDYYYYDEDEDGYEEDRSKQDTITNVDDKMIGFR